MSTVDWGPNLARLRSELAELFAVWLPRLSVLLGPAEARPRPEANGELDGVRGLNRRGSWERLLLTEWALADAVPMEFLRRATDGELLFTEPARVASVHAPVTTVFFDDGPSQLGVPRLVHLALWMVLQERATAAGGELRCFVRSAPHRRLGSDPLQLLAHRSAVLPPLPEVEPGERIVVGQAVAGETTIEVVEVGTTLEVRYAGRRVVFERPPLQAAAAFLSRPEAPRRPHRSGPREQEGITALVVTDGRIHVRFGSVLTIWPIPNRPRKRSKPRHQSGRWRSTTRRSVAIGSFVKQMLLVEVEGDQLVFSGVFGTHRLPVPADLVVAQNHQILPAVGMPRVYLREYGVERRGVVFRDGAGAVWAATAEPPAVVRVGTAVVGPRALDGQLCWITPGGERVTAVYGGRERFTTAPTQALRATALLSSGVDSGVEGSDLTAALVRGDQVWIGRCFGWGRFGEALGSWHPLPPGRLVGVSGSRDVAMLAIEDGRAVLHTGDTSVVLDYALAEEVVHAALTETVVVLSDRSDRVHVYDRRTGNHRVSFGWEDIR